ncbi:MAG: NADPH-dependent F420 reductase [Anaerolineae bacterium]|nr:NADPH-dependent F420 reductase [Anaerolineae bacterium]MCO5190866.1 NADPH-dependent F420 reductase [Anaerolineae bacterium]MCO5194175.1 NADPH-dependent F420 reductase [Anaerolineae bacterium]MCO5197315.1 NADPH-dependent F420 reductase [Anaerolineae bacterium]MCO5204747.1 NADPH-dependent F420 reductase [Anaerolineae bacterium]
MRIGVLGTGRMGTTLGKLWAQNGHEIMFGSREAVRAQALAADIGEGTQGGSLKDSAEFGEVLLLSFPWYAFTDVERAVGNAVDGKIVFDCINPLKSSGSLALGHKWSAGEEIARTWHRAKVVKVFNHIYWQLLEQPEFDGVQADAYYCSNDDQAKAVAAQLSAEIGFNPVDCGPIKHARYLEPLAVLWMQLAFTMHNGPEIAFKLLRR